MHIIKILFFLCWWEAFDFQRFLSEGKAKATHAITPLSLSLCKIWTCCILKSLSLLFFSSSFLSFLYDFIFISPLTFLGLEPIFQTSLHFQQKTSLVTFFFLSFSFVLFNFSFLDSFLLIPFYSIKITGDR